MGWLSENSRTNTLRRHRATCHKKLHRLDLTDDKSRILATAEHLLGDTLRTLFVRQGSYARADAQRYQPADFMIDHIEDLRKLDTAHFG